MSKQSTAMYGISRIDDDTHRTHAWRVSLRRRGKGHVKNFPDKKYGGKRKALQLAKAYRDDIVAKHPPITRKEFSSIIRSNNNSGITGVYRYAKRYYLASGEEVETWYWEGHWPTQRGQYQSVRFSVSEFGEDIARAKALRARKKGMQAVEGVFWASERGQTAANSPANKVATANRKQA